MHLERRWTSKLYIHHVRNRRDILRKGRSCSHNQRYDALRCLTSPFQQPLQLSKLFSLKFRAFLSKILVYIVLLLTYRFAVPPHYGARSTPASTHLYLLGTRLHFAPFLIANASFTLGLSCKHRFVFQPMSEVVSTRAGWVRCRHWSYTNNLTLDIWSINYHD